MATTIVDDPDAAADRFEQAVPEDARPVVWPTYAERRAAERADRREKMRAAAVMQKAGLPYRYIAEAFAVASSTAWRWSREGLRIWEQEHRPEELAAVLMTLMPLDALKEATRPPRRPRKPMPLPEDDAAEFVAWAAARFHLDPDQTAEMLAEVEDPDWDALMAIQPVDPYDVVRGTAP